MTDTLHTRPLCPILGVNLRASDYTHLWQCVSEACRTKNQLRINFCNVHVTMLAQRNSALRNALNHSAALTVPDGMPLVWAMRWWGAKITNRVYGPDACAFCFEHADDAPLRHYFYGSDDDTRTALIDALAQRYPSLSVAGSYSPPFRPLTPEEEDDIVSRINAAQPDIIWVGLGAPRQEIWIDRMADRLHAPVIAAVGAAFDFHAGTVRQAPDWLQNHGLEWLYRLIQEPRRLWFRYCYYNPLFIIKCVCERLFSRRAHTKKKT